MCHGIHRFHRYTPMKIKKGREDIHRKSLTTPASNGHCETSDLARLGVMPKCMGLGLFSGDSARRLSSIFPHAVPLFAAGPISPQCSESHLHCQTLFFLFFYFF